MSTSRRLCLAWSMFGLSIGAATWADLALAQPRPRPPQVDIDGMLTEEQSFDGLSIPKDREATAIIAAAKEYVAKKDWDTVARSLQFLLEKPEDSFFEIARKDEKGKDYIARISIRIEANRLIGELPPEGLETYRQKYGQRAMMMLQEGIDKNDPATLSLVALKYRHTEAGVKAINLLGNYFLDRGNYQMASGKFQDLLELLEKEKPEVKKSIGPKTFFKAALAYQRFGDTAMADKLWKQVVELAGEKGIAFGDRTYTIAELKAEMDRNAQVGSQTLASYQVVRGNASRTALGIGGIPFLEPRFSVSMFVPNKDWEDPKNGEPVRVNTSKWVQEKVRTATDMIEKSGGGKRPMLPGFFPIAGQNRLVFRTYDGIYAFFLRDDPAQGVKAGEISWASDSESSLHRMGSDRDGNRGTFEAWWGQYYGMMSQGMALPGILFENSTVGTLSHDGKNVYYVDDLAMPPHPNQMMQYGFGGSPTPFGTFTDQVLFNTLRALELETGLLKWEIGERKQGGKFPVIQNPGMVGQRIRKPDGKTYMIGPDGKEVEIDPATGQPIKKVEPVKPFVPPPEFVAKNTFVNAADELIDTYFLGAPLPVGGKIYVLVEYNGEIQLCCINPARMGPTKVSKKHREGPELVWRQPLGTANLKLMQDTMRRIQPCHLAYNDGILVCPTNAGAIIAVNMLTQSLAWAYSYRTANPDGSTTPTGPRPIRRFRGDMQMPNMTAERWYAAPPAVVNGTVVFTAPDSNAVICLSLRDGRRLWSVNRQQGDLYMAGVFDNKVLIVGKDSVRALKLVDGTPAWDKPKAIGMPSGQGVASKGKYYLPCRNGVDSPDPQIIEVDIATGDLHATKARKKEIPGNLMFYDGEVISQNIWAVSAYPQLQVKLAEMNTRLTKNPNDPIGLTDRGELHLDKGELASAVTDFKTALDFKPDADTRARARNKLYEALTELLQKDFNKAEENLPLYKELCLNDVEGEARQKRESAYLCLLGKGREAQGKLVEAFDAYMQFGQLNGAREMVPSVDEPGTLARPDVWARGRILAMIAKAKPEEKKPLEERIAKQWQEVKLSDDVEKIRGFVKVFGSMFQSGLEARLVLAEKLMVSATPEDHRQAELSLDGLRRQREDMPLAAQATETLARHFVRKGLLRDAVLLYRVLGTDFKEVKLRDGKTGADVFNELITDKRFLPYLEVNTQLWNSGKMKGELISGPVNAIQTSYFSVDPEGDLLPFFQQHRLVVETQSPAGNGMWQVKLIDRSTGDQKWKSGNLVPNHFLMNQGFGMPNQALGGARFAQVRGHILMMTLKHMIYAWDLASQKKLWEHNLLGKGMNMEPTDTRYDADGAMRLIYQDGTRIRVGQVGLLESSYVCLPTRDGLIAMDPSTGTELWRRDAGNGAYLFGDSDYIFVVESGEDGTPTRGYAVHAADGVTVKVPEFTSLYNPSKRVAVLGRHLLVFADKTLRLYDPLTGQDVWKQTFPDGAKVIRSQERGVTGVVLPDGAVTVMDAHTGKTIMHVAKPDDRIAPEHLNNVQECVLLQDNEFYYVALNKPSEGVGNAYPFLTNGLRSMRVNGTFYSFRKSTAEMNWFQAVTDQFVVLENFGDLPLVIMAGLVNRQNTQQGKVEAWDKQTGRFAGLLNPVPNNGQFYAMMTDPKAGVIELQSYNMKVRYALEGATGPGAGAGGPMGGVQGGAPPIVPPAPPVQLRGNIRVMPAQRVQIQIKPVQVLPPPVKKAEEKPVKD